MTRAEWVTSRVREMIVRGEFAPGARLQEESLAAMLGVSRTPLRAGLMTLTHEGMLDYVANRGYTVRTFRFQEIRDAYRVRSALEGMAARLVAETELPARYDRPISRALQSGDAIVANKTLSPFHVTALVRLNEVFHVNLIATARNSLLEEIVAKAQRIPLASLLTKPTWAGGPMETVDPRQSHYEHRAIYDAVRRRDGDGAEAAMRNHISGALALLSEQYRETSAAAAPKQRRSFAR